MPEFSILAVAPEQLHDLRRRVLRGNDPHARVSDDRDSEETSLHLAGISDGVVLVCASFYPSHSPLSDAVPTWMLRYMAADPSIQGRGWGAAVLRQGYWEVAARGAERLWANGRDTAWGFYERMGWHKIPGSEHLSPETQLPHTVIYVDVAKDN